MSALPKCWRQVAAFLALAGAAHAGPALTTIQDVLYRADGSRFNGTLTIAWTGFLAGDDTPLPTQSLTVPVPNGFFKVQLAPTTSASAGASYTVTYMSQGRFQFSESWAVPSTTAVLRVRDVRAGSGSVVGPPPPVLNQVLISDVTGLTGELGARPMKGAAFSLARTAVINSSGQIDGASGNLSDCLHVDGSSGPCGSSGGDSSSAAFADGETPAGLVNGANTVFNLNVAPSPAASLAFYRNGILMKQGADYTLSGVTVTFFVASVPQPGDLLTASYRYASSAQAEVTSQFADSETPYGAVNGANISFSLNFTPAPPSSLSLFRNGILMKQGADYMVSGTAVTFFSPSTPQPGDLLTAYYRY